MFIKLSIFILPLVSTSFVLAGGNTTNQSFNKAKKSLMSSVYASAEARQTIYCNATFDEKKYVTAPDGFASKTHVKRSKKVEFEHNLCRTLDKF